MTENNVKLTVSKSLLNKSIYENGSDKNKGEKMDIDSNSFLSSNSGSSLDLLMSEIDYINSNDINQKNYIKHKEKIKTNSNFFDEGSDVENQIGKLSNGLDEDSDDNVDNENENNENENNDNEDNDNEDNDNEDNDEDNEDNENEDDNDEENEDENDDSNDEDNKDNESENENSDNDNEDSYMIDEEENNHSLDNSDKEIDNKLKLKIKIKRNQSQDKNNDLILKDKSSSFKDIEENNNTELLNVDLIQKEQKEINKNVENNEKLSLNENKFLNKKDNINIQDSSDFSSSYSQVTKESNKAIENQSKKSVLYEEPTETIPTQTVAQKASAKRSSSVSKNRKNKKFSINNTKGKIKKLKKPPKKIDLLESLNKVLNAIKIKDVYGIFLLPVDTTIVTDYASIIKNPMDFGTMQKKIDNKQYKNISEFQNDFELVIRNAKTYNAPETIYYRSAEKISKVGSKLIEKEIAMIKNVEEKRHLYFQELRRSNKNNNNNNNNNFLIITTNNNTTENLNSNSSFPSNASKDTKIEKPGSTQIKKKKNKRKRRESSEVTLYIPDGSLNPENIKYKLNVFEQYLDKYRQICPLSEQQYHFSIAYDEFEAYGSNRRENFIPHYKSYKDSIYFNIPITDLSNISNSSISQNKIPRNNHVRLNFAYGDILGNTYVKSLERYTENMNDSIKEFVFDYIDAITEGGHSLAKATECLMEDNSNIIDNFTPPSKKIKLKQKLQNSKLEKNQIIKKEINDVEMIKSNDVNLLKLTSYELRQIENIINDIIIKKNYDYEQRELGLVESLIRDNHIDYLSVIQKEKISTIINDIILKPIEVKLDINNSNDRLVSDKLIKSYLESNIIELKKYKEMKSLNHRDIKKEEILEYNIQKRFLEMLNILSGYGINKINKENQLQIKKLEQEISLRKKMVQGNLTKQQELEKQKLEQQKLEQEKIKQREEVIKNRQIDLEKLKLEQLKERELSSQQQKQVKNRQEIGKQLELQLLRQKLEQPKIKATQLTQFDPKKEQNKNIKEQEKLLLHKQQQQKQQLLSFKSDNKLSKSQLKDKNILEPSNINNLQNPSQVSLLQQSPVLKDQNKSTSSSYTNISFNNILNTRKNTTNLPTNINDLKNLSPSQQRLLQHLKYIQLQSQQRRQNYSTSLLNNSKLSSVTSGPLVSISSVNINNKSLKNDIANSKLTSLLGNQKLSTNVGSTNITSMINKNQNLNITNTTPSQTIKPLLTNNKSSLSDKVISNTLSPPSNDISNINSKISQTAGKSEFPSSFITQTTATSNFSSLIESNLKIPSVTKVSNYSSLLSTEQKLNTKNKITGNQPLPNLPKQNTNNNDSLATSTNIPVSQQGPDYSPLLKSNTNFVCVSNLSSLLSTDKNSKSTESPSSIFGNLKNSNIDQQQKPKPTQSFSHFSSSSSSSTSTLPNNNSETLSPETNFSSVINGTNKFSSITPNSSAISSLLMNGKVPPAQTIETVINKNPQTNFSDSNFTSLLGQNNKLSTTLLSSTKDINTSTKSTPDFSSIVLSKAKTEILPSVSNPSTTKPTGPDYSSLLSATIVPSTQSLTDIMGSKKIATTATSSSTSSSVSKFLNDQKLSNVSTTSNLTTLLNTTPKLATSQLDSSFSSLLGSQKLPSTNNYNSLLGVNAFNSSTATKISGEKITPDISMLLPNSGINVSSSMNPYLLSTYTSLPTQTSLPLSLLHNQSILSALQPPSSQQLTNPFLGNNPSTTINAKTTTNNLKSKSKKSQLPTSGFSSPYFF